MKTTCCALAVMMGWRPFSIGAYDRFEKRLGGFDVFPFQRPKVYLRKEIISDSGPIVSSKSIRWKSYYFLRYPRVYTQDVLVHFLMTPVLWATIIYQPISSSIFCRQSCKIIYIIIQPVLFYWTPRRAVTANNERLDTVVFIPSHFASLIKGRQKKRDATAKHPLSSKVD